MALKLFDLVGAEPGRRFSPYCWRTKFALLHEGLPFETIPWRFTDKGVIAFSKQGSVPVLVDGNHVVSDSWAIANYLEDTYANRPSLFRGEGGRAVTKFINAWADGLNGALAPLIVSDIFGLLDDKDRTYFRETREKRFGTTLETVGANRDADVLAWRKLLQPLRAVLGAQPYLGGATPAYADYAVFGCFQWARCVSPFRLLLEDDPVWAWRGRLLSAFDSYPGKAIGYPV